MADVVLVIDMLRGFLEKGPLFCGDPARSIIPRVQKLSAREQSRGSTIIYICDSHVPDDLEFRMFPPHCIAGSEEAQVIPELAAYSGIVVKKRRYSGFYGSELSALLESLRPGKLMVCGTCTSICVLFTVADARNRDYEVAVYRDCVADFDPEAHAFALRHMEKVLGAKVVSLEE